MSDPRDADAPKAEITKTVMYKLGYAVTDFLASDEYRDRSEALSERPVTEDIIWVGDRVLARIADFAIPTLTEAVRYPGLKELNERLHSLGLDKDLFVGITQRDGVFTNIALFTLEEAMSDRSNGGAEPEG